MKSNTFKNIIMISSVYVGTVLGAGFASGQEMMKFFAIYGYKGMFGLLLTGMLFSIIGYMVLKIVYTRKCNSYTEFMEIIVGNNWGRFLEMIVMLFMFICFCAMLAGGGALFQQRFHIPYYYGVVFMAAGCFFTFLFDVKGVVAINTILAPVLLVGILLIGIYIWVFSGTTVGNMLPEALHLIRDNWISSSILYVAYNSITSIVVLCSLGYVLNKMVTVRMSAFIGGASLGLIGLILGLVVLIHYKEVIGLEIPLLGIVMKYSEFIQYIYIVVLVSAMFTTAVANGFGIIERIKENSVILKKHPGAIKLGVVGTAIALSSVGFSTMVGSIYPLFGYAGIFELVCIGIFFIQNDK
ncbi:MAG: hypothetical protein CVU84_16795 [Firmicutes bacterium HGW-Firmicutes-1]|nr:MAG: hypothetical protein CVU84_16795 [Firmicutes bacterium HGW-Firmicutes-1]